MEEGIRNMTPEQRVARVAALTVLAHSFALAQIRNEHPHENERRHRLRLAARHRSAGTLSKTQRVAGAPPLPVITPEDIVLQKLRCYEMGGEISDRQWRDLVSVLRQKRGKIDVVYLRGVAEGRMVELLERALLVAAAP